jgi:alkyldihydroxyacetonephosphate synthase
MKFVNRIAEKYNGLDSGSAPGRYGYFLTFAICYIRDFCLDHEYMGESLETTCSWDNVHKLINGVREAFV